jgi:hypothetical protein
MTEETKQEVPAETAPQQEGADLTISDLNNSFFMEIVVNFLLRCLAKKNPSVKKVFFTEGELNDYQLDSLVSLHKFNRL